MIQTNILSSKNSRGTTLSIDLEPTATVKQLLAELRSEHALKDEDINNAKLIFKGKKLEFDKTLEESGIENCSIITIEQV
ncbi:hypothetical protein Tcan_16189 [Toxocara canis]|uniref:Ubiquitin-like domain-containing protein n=1 Tax=Toxocara canis TaxID=6265 RepID=A0A0B2VGC2_TOXCA|nr:hypothetical protein Tcan_16189 [Toxocara canis]